MAAATPTGDALAAVRKELAAAVLVSMLGYTLAYNTLDNEKPDSKSKKNFKQDFAAVGGGASFHSLHHRCTKLLRNLFDVVGISSHDLAGWGGKDLRMLDHFQMGPNLVRWLRTRPALDHVT